MNNEGSTNATGNGEGNKVTIFGNQPGTGIEGGGKTNAYTPVYGEVHLDINQGKYESGRIVFNSNGVNVLSGTTGSVLPEIEVFLHDYFNLLPTENPNPAPYGGYAGETLISLRTTFDADLKGHKLDKMISSIIVYSGHWQFFDENNNALPDILGPGHYPKLGDTSIQNDKITSFKSVKL